MSISRTTDRTRTIPRIHPAGRRWMSVDTWLKAYDEQRDPGGHYGSIGRNPANVITLKDAS
jgi:hypothetical protein